MAVKLPPPLLFIITAILMKFSPNVGNFHGIFAIVVLLIAAGVALDVASLKRFLQAKTTINPLALEKTSQLVTTGIYRFSRNPMYLSLVCYLLAWGIWLGNALALVWIVPFVVAITYFQILPEEKMLEAKFGHSYTEYKSKTRRWI